MRYKFSPLMNGWHRSVPTIYCSGDVDEATNNQAALIVRREQLNEEIKIHIAPNVSKQPHSEQQYTVLL
jgi:hypothetical protein